MDSFFDKTKPLWLPEGSLRALLALGIMALVSVLVLLSKNVPDWLVLWAGLILQSYFNHRDKVEETEAKAEEKKVEAVVRSEEKKTDAGVRADEAQVVLETPRKLDEVKKEGKHAVD